MYSKCTIVPSLLFITYPSGVLLMLMYLGLRLLKKAFFATLIFVTVQQTSGVLVLQLNGDLWTWTGTQPQLIQRTNWGYNQSPVISPNGKMVAYKSAAQIGVDVIKKSGSVGREIPSNLWLMDTATGDTVRIADQPPDAAFSTSNHADKFIMRSLPTWSEDSKFLAWSQLATDNSTNMMCQPQLIIYNIEKKIDTVIIPTLTFSQCNLPVPPQVQWSESGIAVWSKTVTADGKGGADALLIFDSEGNLLSTITVDGLYEFAWMKDGDKEYIGALVKGPSNQPLDQTQWLLIDPLSGRLFGMPGTPELYSLSSPGGISLFIDSIGVAPEWEIARPNKSIDKLGNVDDVYAFTHTLAISPDGQSIAYVQQGAAYVYSDGKATKIAPSDVSALAWGATGWRVRRSKIGG
ncbi:MAG: hypothetical protein ABI947_14085 [Chloroflexota bacterium]